MDQLIPSLRVLLGPLAPAFRSEVYSSFCLTVVAWIVCLGRRTISRVWETTGHTQQRNHAAAYRLFSEAVWNWDKVCRLLLLHVLALAPGVRRWLVLDDTLAHKRGAKVAFGGIFLDAVLSTKKHKVFRFGNNWVVVGVVVELPFRPNRYFCLSILWRVYQKQGNKPKREHRTKNQLAAEMLAVLAGWLPTREILVVADSAYIGKHLLRQRPANVEALGPIHWKAALYEVLPEAQGRTKHGRRWPTPREMLANDQQGPATKQAIPFKNGVTRELEIKTIRGVCWYDTAGPKAVQVILVRDPAGQWRDEALVCTDVRLSATEILTGYCRRWSVEVAFADAKQLLGFHDPQVWSTLAVGRAAPMAWFVATLVVCWYGESGQYGPQAERHRPWYKDKETPTFADMLAACRLQLGQAWLKAESGSRADQEDKLAWLLEYVATSN
ncbi:MAG TPA: transposase [Gemmataceae bacterium]|nr:transposase [Gemmataceae bacterium]